MTARTIWPQSLGSFSRALPAPLPVIFGMGQPMLMSMPAGDRRQSFSAARAMHRGSAPKSWRNTGSWSWVMSAREAVFLSSNSMALALSISLTVYAAPKPPHIWRKAPSVTPAIGARAAWPFISKLPIFMVSSYKALEKNICSLSASFTPAVEA